MNTVLAESVFCQDPAVEIDQMTPAVEEFRATYSDSGLLVETSIVSETRERVDRVECRSKQDLIDSGFICDCTK
jgi:hypothetical protein